MTPQNLINLLNNPFVVFLLLVDLILKGIALWKAGRNNQLYWFLAILIFNTLGILPLIYILGFQQKRK